MVAVTSGTTNFDHCFRCGSFDIVEGMVFQQYFQGKEKVVWIDNKPVPVRARVCRSCGYVEEFVNFEALQGIIPGKARACPKCDAVYSYQKKHEVSHGVVKCQNCGVEFHLSVQIECPHCHAAYLYSMEKTSDQTVVPCQNCGKSFYLSKDMDVSKELGEDFKR